MNKIVKKMTLLTLVSVITSSLSVQAATNKKDSVEISPQQIEQQNEQLLGRSAGSIIYKLQNYSIKENSRTYLGKVTLTTTTAYNAGIEYKGVTVGASKEYSETREFYEYKVNRTYTVTINSYTLIGQYIGTETGTRTVTEIIRVRVK